MNFKFAGFVGFACGLLVSAGAMTLAAPTECGESLVGMRMATALEKIELDLQAISRQISMR